MATSQVSVARRISRAYDFRMDAKDNKVSLGCGTLIVIALIVVFFSGGRESKRVRKDVQELQESVARLETKIDQLSRKLDAQNSSSPAAPATSTTSTAAP
jgi:hypothetical protein